MLLLIVDNPLNLATLRVTLKNLFFFDFLEF